MNTTTQTAESNRAEFRAESQASRGNSRSDEPVSSIHYAGAKDPRVPLPFVILGFLALAGAAVFVVRHFHP